MAVTSAVASVGTTATALNTSGGRLSLSNPAGQTVFLGGSNVTTANGFPLAASAVKDVALSAGEVLYGIVAATTANVTVLRTGS